METYSKVSIWQYLGCQSCHEQRFEHISRVEQWKHLIHVVVKISQEWIDKSDIKLSNCQYTYSGFIYRNSRIWSWPEGRWWWRKWICWEGNMTRTGRFGYFILYASSNCSSLNMNIFCSSIFEIIYCWKGRKQYLCIWQPKMI